MANEESLRDYIWEQAKGNEPSHLLDKDERYFDVYLGDTLECLRCSSYDGLGFYYKGEFIEFFKKFKDDEEVKMWFDEFGRDDFWDFDSYIKQILSNYSPLFKYLTEPEEAMMKKMYKPLIEKIHKSFFDEANGIEKILELASLGDAKDIGDFFVENNFISKAKRKKIDDFNARFFDERIVDGAFLTNLAQHFADNIIVDAINAAYRSVAGELYDDYLVAQNVFDYLSPKQIIQQTRDNFGNIILAESPNGYEETVKEIDIALKNFVDKYSETLHFNWKGDGQNRLFAQELTTLRNIVVENINKIQGEEVFLWAFEEKMHEMGVQFLNGYYNEQDYKDRLVDAQIPSLFKENENKTKIRRKQ